MYCSLKCSIFVVVCTRLKIVANEQWPGPITMISKQGTKRNAIQHLDLYENVKCLELLADPALIFFFYFNCICILR